MKPFGIFSLTRLFKRASGLSHLVHLTCRESVRLICCVTLIITEHVFTPIRLLDQYIPILVCPAVKCCQIEFVELAALKEG